MIDVQRLLVDAMEPARRTEFLNVLRDVIARARGAGVPVVYVRHQDEEFVPGTTPWEIAAEIAPLEGEAIVEKRFRDSFRETNLEDVLQNLGAGALVVTGMQSEFCVDATMREAERRGYRVTLPYDAHATLPADDATEEQIRRQVHRVAWGATAEIVPSSEIFR